MSNSYRYTPIGGCTTAASEKEDKRIINRRFRRKTRLALIAGREPPIHVRQISDIWNMDKDGKRWFGWQEGCEWWERFMRK